MSLFIIHVTILSFNFNAFAQSSLKRTDQMSCMCRLRGRLTELNAKHSLIKINCIFSDYGI